MPDPALALFEEHRGWASKIARNLARKLPPSFDLADLEQEAHIALWRRAQAYDQAKNDNFRGYAYLAVHGAVLMVCRRRHWTEATHEPLKVASEMSDGTLSLETALLNREERRARMRRLLSAKSASDPEAMVIIRMILMSGAEVAEVARTLQVRPHVLVRRLQVAFRIEGLIQGEQSIVTDCAA